MIFPPVGQGLDQSGSFPLAGAMGSVQNRFVDDFHVITVNLHAGDVITGGPCGDICPGSGVMDGCGEGVLVVFAKENDGETLYSRQVQGFVKNPFIACPVSKKDQHNLIGLPQMSREGGSGSQPHAGTDDAVGPQDI